LIAILDADGTIVLTNAAWNAGSDRRLAVGPSAGCGVNYLELCERSDAAGVAAGIRAVLEGDRPRFEFEYPCPTATEDAWFSLEVLPLGEPGSGVLLTHTNITGRVTATRLQSNGREVEPVTMLATSPAGVTGLARMLAEAQSHGHSVAVVSITLANLVDIESLHGRRSRDELVVQVVARVRRLTRERDAMVRASTNQLLLFASVSDVHGAEFLRSRIAEVLAETYLVGAAEIDVQVDVAVTASDQFSTLDTLLVGGSSEPLRQQHSADHPLSDLTAHSNDDAGDTREDDAFRIPLAVYSLPDGFLQAANEAARSLFGLKSLRPGRLHLRDIAAPIDLHDSAAALEALSSGATDSYRAQRTLITADGPQQLLTSVRRLVVGNGALAIVLSVPDLPEEPAGLAAEDPFAAALVAGTIDAHGVILSVSAAISQLESELVAALTETLPLAAHPDETDLVDTMLKSLRDRGNADGVFRVLHSERGWVVCQCQLFTIKRHPGADARTEAPVVANDAYGFVLSANVNTKSMIDKIARLEHHIRRIGSEVHAADLELTVRSSVDRDVSSMLDSLALTARQRDIVERLDRGQRVPSIAAALFISRSTVRNHLAHVYRLVDVHSQEELLNALRASV
jgi:DNA-binding CsgD family transcriptional regulator/GGDEF domain-containing protein